jgi:ligand-binding SRPBCC domain-containing protein
MLFITEQWFPHSVEQVFRFFADPRNLELISPPEMGARVVAARLARPQEIEGNTHGLAGAGSELTISMRLVPFFPFRAIWKARIIDFEWNRYFRDVQVKGPFRRFDHLHEVQAATCDGVVGTRLRDRVDYSIGFGPATYFLDPTIVRAVLQRMFDYRHCATAQLLEGTRHNR